MVRVYFPGPARASIPEPAPVRRERSWCQAAEGSPRAALQSLPLSPVRQAPVLLRARAAWPAPQASHPHRPDGPLPFPQPFFAQQGCPLVALLQITNDKRQISNTIEIPYDKKPSGSNLHPAICSLSEIWCLVSVISILPPRSRRSLR